MKQRRRRRGTRLTSRDLKILKWVGRHGLVTAPQVARRFGIARNKAHARLRVLKANQLASHRRVLHNQPGVYVATRQGLALTALDLPVCSISLATYQHSLTAVDVAATYETGGLTVLTERELRREQGRGESRFLLSFAGVTHRPDLVVLASDPGPVAIEVELTQKGSRRLETILSAYQSALAFGRIAFLVYVVPDEAARERVASLADTLFLDERQFRVVLLGEAL